jgi:hypothetical protein
VTRLGEFLPNEQRFSSVIVLEILEVANKLGYFFPRKMLCVDFAEKISWATFWAIFLQTHLATLIGSVCDGAISVYFYYKKII